MVHRSTLWRLSLCSLQKWYMCRPTLGRLPVCNLIKLYIYHPKKYVYPSPIPRTIISLNPFKMVHLSPNPRTAISLQPTKIGVPFTCCWLFYCTYTVPPAGSNKRLCRTAWLEMSSIVVYNPAWSWPGTGLCIHLNLVSDREPHLRVTAGRAPPPLGADMLIQGDVN